MTSEEKVIKNKLGLLTLAEKLGNVSEACRIMGYARDSFYRFREIYSEHGAEGLREISRKKPNQANRVAPEVEKAVLKLATDNPAYGQKRDSNELKKRGIFVSPGGVRWIWLRHNLETFKKGLKALEAMLAADNTMILTEAQLQAMEKSKPITPVILAPRIPTRSGRSRALGVSTNRPSLIPIAKLLSPKSTPPRQHLQQLICSTIV